MYKRKSKRRGKAYVNGYLKSVPWFRRRALWFRKEKERQGDVRCIVCHKAGQPRRFELHHLDYRGVARRRDRWWANERHEDLVACHRRCHEWIHTLLDRDKAANAAIDRRVANARVINHLRHKIGLNLVNWSSNE